MITRKDVNVQCLPGLTKLGDWIVTIVRPSGAARGYPFKEQPTEKQIKKIIRDNNQ